MSSDQGDLTYQPKAGDLCSRPEKNGEEKPLVLVLSDLVTNLSTGFAWVAPIKDDMGAPGFCPVIQIQGKSRYIRVDRLHPVQWKNKHQLTYIKVIEPRQLSMAQGIAMNLFKTPFLNE